MTRRPRETYREFLERSARRDLLLSRLEHLAVALMAAGATYLWVSILVQG